ncbi:condensation domain-containing protein [Streptomyces sp. SLBN-118]|uniref:condensation domain-containing protein n=1 Tax=Streptomyces sp. SLBN-118 TaxID=2768454 RepID=UPI0011514457|nr:condensation domain-containing protein [Streptomyces sp. SLBN-118]TQK50327.1 condensation domain-containing protein [Streptomyces sp. SLBN-118]
MTKAGHPCHPGDGGDEPFITQHPPHPERPDSPAGEHPGDGPLLPDGTPECTTLSAGAPEGSDCVPLTPQQHSLLLDAIAHPGTGRYVEQLVWRWQGPLDTLRFTAAWQAVFDRESVLRAAFDVLGEPRIVLHEHVRAQVVRHAAGAVAWDELVERDRLSGFDLGSPGLLRITLVDEPPAPAGPPAAATRILLTHHHVLLDGWSVVVLLQEFYRAYLAGGELPGGERRPDIRDYTRWLAAQDTGPARGFWSRALTGTAPPLTLMRPGPGPVTGQRGHGRAAARLDAAEAELLRTWAAGHAATEAGALQALWAILLYRASDARGPAPVGFGVAVSGRGIPLEVAERLPGLLMNVLPMTIQVDPAQHLPLLLAQLRDLTLDMAAYEWVSLEQIQAWSGRPADEQLLDSVLVFAHCPRMADGLETALAAQDICVSLPGAVGSPAAYPVVLLAGRDADGGLALTAVHDRGRIADDAAGQLLGQCIRLLRQLPHTADDTTVGDILHLLCEQDPPPVTG